MNACHPWARRVGAWFDEEVSSLEAAEVRDKVFVRDGGRCTFTAADGTRCGSKRSLQVDHVRPYVAGGTHKPSNLRLLCAAHNRLAAERTLGKHVMSQYWRRE